MTTTPTADPTCLRVGDNSPGDCYGESHCGEKRDCCQSSTGWRHYLDTALCAKKTQSRMKFASMGGNFTSTQLKLNCYLFMNTMETL